MLKDAYTLVTVYYINVLTNQDLPYQRKRIEEAQEGYISLHHWNMRKMVDLHSVGHISYSRASILKLICDEDYLMTSFHEALS